MSVPGRNVPSLNRLIVPIPCLTDPVPAPAVAGLGSARSVRLNDGDPSAQAVVSEFRLFAGLDLIADLDETVFRVPLVGARTVFYPVAVAVVTVRGLADLVARVVLIRPLGGGQAHSSPQT